MITGCLSLPCSCRMRKTAGETPNLCKSHLGQATADFSTLHTDIHCLILPSCKSNLHCGSLKDPDPFEDFTRNCGHGNFLITRHHGAGSVEKRVIEYLLINYRHDRNKFAILYFERSIPGNFLSESSNEFVDQGQF